MRTRKPSAVMSGACSTSTHSTPTPAHSKALPPGCSNQVMRGSSRGGRRRLSPTMARMRS